MLDFAADFQTFFSDFAEEIVFDGTTLTAVLEPVDVKRVAADALDSVDLIVFFRASEKQRANPGQAVVVNNRRYIVNYCRENYGVVEIALTKKEGF